ncbi:MAG: alkaline phosphatase family protein [Candidatus Kapabacteria bacterium]|jgi:alkaline phosphatase D|nr:alkaline phosphatase family protein [Candidatus Kapabacteria bacterium]
MKFFHRMLMLLCVVIMTAKTGEILAQNPDSLLQSGPMVGYAQMREVALWAQTKQAARVKFVYYETTIASVRYETDEVQTSKNDAFTAHCLATDVEPSRKYTYELYINGKKVNRPYPLEFQTPKLWQWRGDPPTFKVAMGSCAYVNEIQYERPGKYYGSEYQIFTTIHAKRPDLMLWLGDNVYTREVDWNSRTGVLKRYTHTRSLPEMQPLLASTHNYALWDDHDYGPNDADRSFWGKHFTLDAFKLFWANPSYGVMGKPSCITQFEWGDAEFFCLDDRTFRSPNNRKTGAREMFGDEQIQWLIDALSSSKATFKFIAAGGQILNPLAIFENYATFPEERQKLLDLIEKEGIKGVIFLTGDRHHTELNKLERKGTYPLYEFTISSLTAGTNPKAVDEANPLRVSGTFTAEHNFAVFEFSGAFKDRTLKCTVYNPAGKELWTYSINSKDIR